MKPKIATQKLETNINMVIERKEKKWKHLIHLQK